MATARLCTNLRGKAYTHVTIALYPRSVRADYSFLNQFVAFFAWLLMRLSCHHGINASGKNPFVRQ